MTAIRKITEWRHVDPDTFHSDIVSRSQPAVIRSLVGDWPAVQHCKDSGAATCEYLSSLDKGASVYTIAAPSEAEGRFFYSADLRGVNFNRGQIPLAQVLQQLNTQQGQPQAHAISIQSLPVRESLPGFESENRARLVDPDVAPTMWIGTAGKVAPHYDVHKNLACVVAGRRQFTLFPPEQIANLYLGPMLNAPGGVPMSLVDIWNPDFDRFPRYENAQAEAMQATLGPGDAIYIPSLWWHAVAALEPVNVLVNYWWGGISDSGVSPNDSLLHALLTIPGLDAEQRRAWRSFFDYMVFRIEQDPTADLPDGLEDILTSLNPKQAEAVRELLATRLANSK